MANPCINIYIKKDSFTGPTSKLSVHASMTNSTRATLQAGTYDARDESYAPVMTIGGFCSVKESHISNLDKCL